jgi:hypothetical protein
MLAADSIFNKKDKKRIYTDKHSAFFAAKDTNANGIILFNGILMKPKYWFYHHQAPVLHNFHG